MENDMDNNYQLINLKNVLTVKNICTIHYFKYCKQFKFVGEKHNFWEIVYIDSGEVGVLADDKAFNLKQGEAIFHKPNEYHNICTADKFANSAIITFECNSRAMNFFKDKILKFNDYEKELMNKIIIEGSKNYEEKLNDIYLLKMTKKQSAPFGGEQLIKNYIELLLISLIRNNTTVSNQERISESIRSKHSNEIVDKILKILSNNIYNEINLTTIANELYFSKTYLKNLFAKQTGTSIIQSYINLKIEEAKKLISQNKYSFTEIGFMLNFNSVHYFSRLFKLHTGMSPSEYAKTIKVDNILD
jgi:AraC-like DNA-binding protein